MEISRTAGSTAIVSMLIADAQGVSHPGKSNSDVTKACEDQMKRQKN